MNACRERSDVWPKKTRFAGAADINLKLNLHAPLWALCCELETSTYQLERQTSTRPVITLKMPSLHTELILQD